MYFPCGEKAILQMIISIGARNTYAVGCPEESEFERNK